MAGRSTPPRSIANQNKKGELDRSISFTQADAELVAEVVKRATTRLGELSGNV